MTEWVPTALREGVVVTAIFASSGAPEEIAAHSHPGTGAGGYWIARHGVGHVPVVVRLWAVGSWRHTSDDDAEWITTGEQYGALFPKNAAGSANTGGTPGKGRGFRTGRRHSRVDGHPEVLGEFPVSTLASEILTPGEGQIRALVTVAGNPVVSTPDAGRLDAALADLEFMVSVDIYRNETTRHADVILPPGGILTKEHFDLAFYSLSIRNVANYSPPINELPEGELHEWEILLRLAAIAGGAQGSAEEGAGLDDFIIGGLCGKAAQRDDLPSADEMLDALEPYHAKRAIPRGASVEEIADVARHQEIMLHETLDGRCPGAGAVAEARRDFTLQIVMLARSGNTGWCSSSGPIFARS